MGVSLVGYLFAIVCKGTRYKRKKEYCLVAEIVGLPWFTDVSSYWSIEMFGWR